MSVFMVERDLKGISMEALGGAQKAAIGKAKEMSASGTDIKYLRSTFAPDDEDGFDVGAFGHIGETCIWGSLHNRSGDSKRFRQMGWTRVFGGPGPSRQGFQVRV